MFEKSYIILNNKKKIKAKNINIIKKKENETIAEITLPVKYFGYFNSDATSIKSGYFKGLFYKSNSFYLDESYVPEYEVYGKLLKITQKIESL